MPEISPPPPIDKNPASKRIAFLVIHGIGQQRPYETLAQFGRGPLESFASDRMLPPGRSTPSLKSVETPTTHDNPGSAPATALRLTPLSFS